MNSPLPDLALAPSEEPPASATVGAGLRDLARIFRGQGLDSPELDARLLVCAACGLSHEALAAAPERALHAREASRIDGYRRRRLDGEPVSRILGVREFHGLRFALSSHVLDPRPDTETLVDALLGLAQDAESAEGAVSILDMGTGSGCILVSALHALPQACGVGCDIDPGALAAARLNAEAAGVATRARFVCGSWLSAVSGRFDFVVSNPPYIPGGDIDALAPEVARFDPRAALDGGLDGLDAYREICAGIGDNLTPRGWTMFEVGAGQHEAVLDMLCAQGFGGKPVETRTYRDLSGITRCVAARALIERT